MPGVIFRKPCANHGVVPFPSVSGLGLVEVMISTFIICLAMIGVSRLHNTQVQIAHLQERRLAAMALLDDKLADLRLIAHCGIMDNTGGQSPAVKGHEMKASALSGVSGKTAGRPVALIGNDRGGALSAGEIRYDQYTFQLHWTVVPLPEGVFKLLTVTVAWQDGQGKLLSVSGNTVISAPTALPAS